MTLLLAAAFTGASLLSQIAHTYAAHPQAPFVTYTLRREQLTADGMPDLLWSYTDRVWYRASDSTALERRDFRGHLGGLHFAKVSFNGPWDPGPPTADPFGLAHITALPAVTVNSAYPTIASVVSNAGPSYEVTSTELKGGEWHLRVRPFHVTDTHILRELWADATTFELRKAIVADKLFIEAGPVFDQLDTMTFAIVNAHVAITHIHARANFDEQPGGAGSDVDYDFSDVAYPASLPDWYFQPNLYGAHIAEAPG